MKRWLFIAALLLATPAWSADVVRLYAAGSLRDALDETRAAFTQATGIAVEAKYGPSGLLKDEIAGVSNADVFASANMDHPQALARAGKGGPVVLFARNRLCALVRPGLAVDQATLLDRMLDPSTKLGTSTPKSDPSGDYAWEVFRKADALRPGAFATLSGKALQLMGGPNTPPAPTGRVLYGALVADGKADIFLTYCTGARAARRENPDQQIVEFPEALMVGADYGLTVMLTAAPAAYRFAMFVLSDGQRILSDQGFVAPNLPSLAAAR
ncbi:MAG: molybdate ABC transporter substrate-binding protein [Xanthobacteraceae bacterium]|nr:molybdate ABC transporter substrate-binding protein [Xanthobacteraceae bacterium]